MLFEAMLSDEDMEILQRAVDRALQLAEERGLSPRSDYIVARLCEAYFNGERTVQRLAEAALVEKPLLH